MTAISPTRVQTSSYQPVRIVHPDRIAQPDRFTPGDALTPSQGLDNRLYALSVNPDTERMLTPALEALDSLSTKRENWNGTHVAAPSLACLKRADQFLHNSCKLVIDRYLRWENPHITADEAGNTVLEWWGQNAAKLTIYVTPDREEFIRVWGANTDTEMEDGAFSSDADFLNVWKWLLGVDEE